MYNLYITVCEKGQKELSEIITEIYLIFDGKF